MSGISFARRVAAFAVATAVVAVLGGCSSIEKLKHNAGYDEPWSEGADGTILKDVVYKPVSGNRIDICLPKVIDGSRGNGVIVFLHGGSWVRGTRAFESHNCKRYAKKGYIAATVDYTLYSDSSPVTMGRMLDDVDDAVDRIKALSAERGWNVTQMGISGNSAGGQLALLYAYARKPALPLKFVAATVAPADFHWEAWDFKGALFSPRVSLQIVNAGTGSSFSEAEFRSGKAEAAIRSISPLFAVHPGAVPTLLGYGEKDTLQNPENGRRLVEKLAEAGVPHDLVMYPHSGHLLADDRPVMLEFHEKLTDYARKGFGY